VSRSFAPQVSASASIVQERLGPPTPPPAPPREERLRRLAAAAHRLAEACRAEGALPRPLAQRAAQIAEEIGALLED